jgi:hypothetical protein
LRAHCAPSLSRVSPHLSSGLPCLCLDRGRTCFSCMRMTAALQPGSLYLYGCSVQRTLPIFGLRVVLVTMKNEPAESVGCRAAHTSRKSNRARPSQAPRPAPPPEPRAPGSIGSCWRCESRSLCAARNAAQVGSMPPPFLHAQLLPSHFGYPRLHFTGVPVSEFARCWRDHGLLFWQSGRRRCHAGERAD